MKVRIQESAHTSPPYRRYNVQTYIEASIRRGSYTIETFTILFFAKRFAKKLRKIENRTILEIN